MPATLETSAQIDEIESVSDRPAWRPSCRTFENREAILKVIGKRGFTFSRACSSVGVSKQAGSDWRIEDPDFADAVERAESEFIAARVDDLIACKNNNGTPDVKAQELMLRRFSEYQQTQRSEIETRNLSVSVSLSGDQLASLQGKWQQALEDGAK